MFISLLLFFIDKIVPKPFSLNLDYSRLLDIANFDLSCSEIDVYIWRAASNYLILCERDWIDEFDCDLSIVFRCSAKIWVSEGCSTDLFLELLDFEFCFNYFLFGLKTPFFTFGWIFLNLNIATCTEIVKLLLCSRFPQLS